MHKCLQRKKAKLYLEGIPKIERCANDDFPILRSRNFCLHISSKVQSLAPHKSNPLVLQKNISKNYAIRNENADCSFLAVFMMSLHGKLIAVASRWLVKVFFLKSNDVLDAVLSTDRGQQRCFNFLIRQFLSLNNAKIICSITR